MEFDIINQVHGNILEHLIRSRTSQEAKVNAARPHWRIEDPERKPYGNRFGGMVQF